MNANKKEFTNPQLAMIRASGEKGFFGGGGCGVEIRGAGQWAIARSLVKMGFGTIEGGIPNGSFLPGLYFNNEDGISVLHEDEEAQGMQSECHFAA